MGGFAARLIAQWYEMHDGEIVRIVRVLSWRAAFRGGGE